MIQTRRQQNTIRHQLWLDCIDPFLKQYHIKPSHHILHFYGTPNFKTDDLLKSYVPEGRLSTYDVYSRRIPRVQSDAIQLEDNSHHLSIFTSDPNVIPLDCLSDFIDINYKTLKPTGRLLIVFPSNQSTTRVTYRKVMETGQYPQIERDTLTLHDILLSTLQQTLEQSAFVSANFDTFRQNIELADIYQFQHYLSLVSNLYGQAMPDEIRNEIILLQTRYFEEICEAKYNGRLIFEYDIHAIPAAK